MILATINLHNRKFSSLQNSDNGEVGSDTIFHYRQKDQIVWATYEGGQIVCGTLSGRIDGQELHFNYQHQNVNGEMMTGRCITQVEHADGEYILNETWEWTCGDYSKGTSVLIEI